MTNYNKYKITNIVFTGNINTLLDLSLIYDLLLIDKNIIGVKYLDNFKGMGIKTNTKSFRNQLTIIFAYEYDSLIFNLNIKFFSNGSFQCAGLKHLDKMEYIIDFFTILFLSFKQNKQITLKHYKNLLHIEPLTNKIIQIDTNTIENLKGKYIGNIYDSSIISLDFIEKNKQVELFENMFLLSTKHINKVKYVYNLNCELIGECYYNITNSTKKNLLFKNSILFKNNDVFTSTNYHLKKKTIYNLFNVISTYNVDKIICKLEFNFYKDIDLKALNINYFNNKCIINQKALIDINTKEDIKIYYSISNINAHMNIFNKEKTKFLNLENMYNYLLEENNELLLENYNITNFIYEPSKYTGLIIKFILKTNIIKFIIFHSGAILISGKKTSIIDDLIITFNKLLSNNNEQFIKIKKI